MKNFKKAIFISLLALAMILTNSCNNNKNKKNKDSVAALVLSHSQGQQDFNKPVFVRFAEDINSELLVYIKKL